MKILAIDTSSNICSTALLEDNNLIDENNLDNGRTHSENLMPLVKELLERNNIKLSEIDLIAVSCGPGSFTGIRIGIASVKAMAEIHNIPVAEVTSLETLAANDNSDRNKITMIDARNNQVYCGVFDKEYNLLDDYIADDINEIIAKISKYSGSSLIGNGAILHKELLSKIEGAIFIENNNQSAYKVGQIGYKKFLAKDLKNADTVMPIYLRKSQAERMKK